MKTYDLDHVNVRFVEQGDTQTKGPRTQRLGFWVKLDDAQKRINELQEQIKELREELSDPLH